MDQFGLNLGRDGRRGRLVARDGGPHLLDGLDLGQRCRDQPGEGAGQHGTPALGARGGADAEHDAPFSADVAQHDASVASFVKSRVGHAAFCRSRSRRCSYPGRTHLRANMAPDQRCQPARVSRRHASRGIGISLQQRRAPSPAQRPRRDPVCRGRGAPVFPGRRDCCRWRIRPKWRDIVIEDAPGGGQRVNRSTPHLQGACRVG